MAGRTANMDVWYLVSGRSAAWLARLPWEQEVGSSNLLAPTTISTYCLLPYNLFHFFRRFWQNEHPERRDIFLSSLRTKSLP